MRKGCKPAIAVHGGAGTWDRKRSEAALKSVREAAEIGFKVMIAGGSAVDAVVEAVAFMEDSGNFNAGAGSALNIEKRVEMEASVMDGATLQAGAVGLLSDVRNPVRLARLVMEKTDHVFVVGKGTDDLARMFGVERRQSVTAAQLERYEAQLKNLLAGSGYLPRLADLVKAHPEIFQLETVGAVALDNSGSVAAATSTGGFPLKLAGRIGDSPSIGCGTYADNCSGACSVSGVGEIAIRLVLAKAVCDYMGNGRAPQEAAEAAIVLIKERIPNAYNVMGLIAVDVNGRIGAAHSTSNLCWAYMTVALEEPVALLKAKLVK
ncbi:MAG: isoaspartyl peptidase/L-asparaginase [Candidatus Bathyarchaeia archaeon]